MFIDNIWIEFVNKLCVFGGKFFTPFFRVISFLGEKGWFFLFIAFLLLLSKKTRWIGATIILSIFLGFITASVLIKPFIMRLRPYETSKIWQDYWEMAGGIPDTGYSMPSGHTVACASFFISLFISCKKKYKDKILLIGIIFTVLMIMSRTYLMHHHLTDCIAGVILSIFTSYIAKFIIKLVYKFCKTYEDIGIFNFILNFDLYKINKS